MQHKTINTTILFLSLLSMLNVSPIRAQWVQTNNPQGANINVFVDSPNGFGGTNIYAGTDRGLYVSTNRGNSWNSVLTGLTDIGINALAVGRGNGSHTTLFVGSERNGIFLSTDNAATWIAADSGLPKTIYQDNSIAYPTINEFGISDQNVFVGTNEGVFLSRDNGSSWIARDSGLVENYVLDIAVIDTNIFVATYKGVFRSTDNGNYWIAVYTGWPMYQGFEVQEPVPATVLAIHSDVGGHADLLAGTYSSGMFLSTDYGNNWIAADSGIPTGGTISALTCCPDESTGSSTIVAGVSLPGFLSAPNGSIFRSTNNGTSWNVADSGLPNTIIHALITTSNETGESDIFAGTGTIGFGRDGLGRVKSGVFRSSDKGNRWVEMNNGIQDINIHSFLVNGDTANEKGLLTISERGIYRSIDDGNSWNLITPELQDIDIIRTACVYPNKEMCTMLLSTWSDVYRSTDRGIHWAPSLTGLQDVNVFAFSDTTLLAGTQGRGVFRSTDDGITWEEINNDLSNKVIVDIVISSTKKIYAATYHELYVSSDNGENWSMVDIGLPENGSITKLIENRCSLFVGTSGAGIFRSQDDGVHWLAVNDGWPSARPGCTFPYEYVESFAICDENIFAGTWGDVYRTTDDGNNWISIGSEIGESWINSLIVHTDYLFAATQEHGVWKRPLSEIVTTRLQFSDKAPKKFVFCQNYPNPFNPSTTIHFEIPQSGEVSLVVYDMLGREVQTLVDEYRHAGKYDVEFNASHLSSGIYFYTMRTEKFTATKKLMLLK